MPLSVVSQLPTVRINSVDELLVSFNARQVLTSVTVAASIFIIGAVIQTATQSKEMMMAGRFFAGIGIGQMVSKGADMAMATATLSLGCLDSSLPIRDRPSIQPWSTYRYIPILPWYRSLCCRLGRIRLSARCHGNPSSMASTPWFPGSSSSPSCPPHLPPARITPMACYERSSRRGSANFSPSSL